MSKSITPKKIRENNRQLIYQYLYHHSNIAQQDIIYALRLSRPTVANKLAEMEEAGLVLKGGSIASDSAGRKAVAYSINPLYRIAIGVEITDREFKIIAVDLFGQNRKRKVVSARFSTDETYFETLGCEIKKFIAGLSVSDEQILGIGFAVQALVSSDGQTITYGRIQNCTGLTIDRIERYLPYPCSFIHDAASAATAELWASPDLTDAVFLSLSYHFSSAVIENRTLITGKHGHNGALEHIQIVPNGKKCYCGHYGCVETVCSIDALLREDETIEDFFQKVRAKEPEESARWDSYLTSLAQVINNAHLFCDLDYILGGYLAHYMTADDLQYLYQKIRELSSFEEPDDFIHLSRMPEHSTTIGAALPYIRQFLNISD